VCTRNLINEAVTTVPIVVAAQLPSQSLIPRTIPRVRTKVEIYIQNPLTVNDLNILLEYQLVNKNRFYFTTVKIIKNIDLFDD